jgi:acyl-coenzyme A synthetase/AMP-(fatty) acid ligase
MIAHMASYHARAAEKPDTSSLRLLTSAGEALPPELYRRWVDATGVEILDGIGSAEMFHVFISARLGEVVPGSLGTLVPGYEARIVGPDGQDVPDGDVGTLHVGGGSSAAFYWNRQDQSREVLQGYWVVTSDLFRRDEKGHFWYQGRASETLKVGGRWVQPQEVEAELTRDDAVAEAGVAPFQQEGLTKPMAFVVLAPNARPSPELEARLKGRVADALAPFKAPRFVAFVDALPRGDRDKLDRPRLTALAAEAAAERAP